MSDVEDAEAEELHDVYFKPSFVLIAIDTHPSMFVKKENEDGTETHPFKDCLEACYRLADSLILATNRSSWSQFGVLLAYDDPVKANFVDIENNILDSIKILKRESRLTNEKLKEKYERKDELALSNFFLLCKKKFKDIKSAFYKRTIIFITNDDDPVENDENKRFTAINEAKTFEPSEIKFQLISMRTDFKYDIFYNELLSVYSEPYLVEEICKEADGLFEKLSSSIVMPFTKRKLAFYPFKNDRKRYLKVVKVDFIRTAKLYNNDKFSKDGKRLKRVHVEGTFERPADSLKYIIPNKRGFTDDLTLDLKDKYDIYNNDFPLGYNLLYVSKRNTEIGFTLSPPSLLQVDPKEDLPFFDTFWQYCVENDKVLVCLRKYRSLDKIRFVELIPKFANNMKLFLIKHIPFATEIYLPLTGKTEPLPEPSQRKIECVDKLIDELTFDYDPQFLPNPNYEKKKAYVKAKLLDEPQEDTNDNVVDIEEMDGRLERIVKNIKESFNLEAVQGKKRKAAAPRGAPKKPK